MMYIFHTHAGSASAGTTSTIPVPCKGRVVAARACSPVEIANSGAETIDIQRGTTSVNLITTAATYVVKTNVAGVSDTTNGKLEFDPASATAANQVITVAVSQLAAAGEIGICITFDETSNPYADMVGS